MVIQEKLEDLLGVVLKVQLQTDFCVFIDLSGHVNTLCIKVTKTKEDYNDDVDNFEIDLGKPDEVLIDIIIKRMKKYLKGHADKVEWYTCTNKYCIKHTKVDCFQPYGCDCFKTMAQIEACSRRKMYEKSVNEK